MLVSGLKMIAKRERKKESLGQENNLPHSTETI
jgi:hypothetical protein